MRSIILIITCIVSFESYCQNLFSNGDFENYTTCPSSLGQINNVDGIEACTVTPDYYNAACGFLPSVSSGSTWCSMDAESNIPSGDGFIGFFGGLFNSTNYQYESLVLTLDNSTVNGQTYTISFDMFSVDRPFGPCYAYAMGDCIDFGIKFFKSSVPIDCPTDWSYQISNPPHPTPDLALSCNSIAIGAWGNHQLTYVADDVYDRVLIYFYPNSNTGNASCSSGTGKFFMDQLCIRPENGTCETCNLTIDAGENQTVCEGDDITLAGSFNGGNTSWSTSGDGTFVNPSFLSTVYSPGPTDISNGSVQLTLTSEVLSAPCTQMNDVVDITISTNADASFVAPEIFCLTDEEVQLESNETGGTWTGNGITDANLGIFSPNNAGEGTHDITYTIAGTCGDQHTEQISVTPQLNADFEFEFDEYCIPNNNPSPIIYGDLGGSFAIDNNGSINSTDGTIYLSSMTEGEYIITYQFDSECSSIDYDTISICQSYEVSIPNVFTPNNDNLNDFVSISFQGVKSIKGVILNRWGNVVIEISEENLELLSEIQIWDGQNAVEGTYFYQFIIKDNSELEYPYEGFIQLIR